MKLSAQQLRRVIQEAFAPAKSPKIVLGGVYYGSRGQEINVQFIEGDHVAYDLLSGGKLKSVIDARMAQLRALLIQGSFKLDHVESW
jgi:hypothetical protein